MCIIYVSFSVNYFRCSHVIISTFKAALLLNRKLLAHNGQPWCVIVRSCEFVAALSYVLAIHMRL